MIQLWQGQCTYENLSGRTQIASPFLVGDPWSCLGKTAKPFLDRATCPDSDLSKVGAKAGMTTRATEAGPSTASWFLERKLGDG